MNIKSLYYPEVSVQKSKTDDYNPLVKVEDGIVWVEVINERGKKYWCRADALISESMANDRLVGSLIGKLWDIAIWKLKMPKAELKRRFIKAGLISK